MKFDNIERNILYLLGQEWLKSKSIGPFDTGVVFNTFPDIPDKNMKDALNSMKESGFVELTTNYRTISLTQKGLSKIDVIALPEEGKIPAPREI